jgi:hypothetical protein
MAYRLQLYIRSDRAKIGICLEQFHCGEINILIALDDVGPGDGATMLVGGRPLPAWTY